MKIIIPLILPTFHQNCLLLPYSQQSPPSPRFVALLLSNRKSSDRPEGTKGADPGTGQACSFNDAGENGIECRNRALIAFTLLTGARDSAIASMKLKHVDLST